MNQILKKIVNITIGLTILDMLLPIALDTLFSFKEYPSFRRLIKLSKKIRGYR